MNRGYTRDSYMERISTIKKIIPGCAISTDIIAGFCGESENDHKDTLSMMQWVEYDFAFMFKYSERPDTYAAKKLKNDVPESVKTQRLNEIINLQNILSAQSKQKDMGKVFEVLVEGKSKRSDLNNFGRTIYNKVVVFPKENSKPGEYVNVKITDFTSATLLGEIVKH
jgi:tRNA-2-methylthio-N6-dimethylallyladenosine synthase